MSSKSTRHRHNQATESRLLDESPIEQRAVQIAREEGRGLPTEDDRDRARKELLAPNEEIGDPEVVPELGKEITAWDEAPESKGVQIENVGPEDETAVEKELAEKGLRGPRRTRKGDDPLWRPNP